MSVIQSDKITRVKDSGPDYTVSLSALTVLFFMWGFIVSMNDVLIPKLMTVFNLLHWQAMLIQTAYFGAYFIISLAYFFLSVYHEDPIVRIGYKNGIITGLVICAVGALLFYPAAAYHSYAFFLTALFILASGTAILQIAANPYVTILGPPESASSRLNMTQALNSLGTTIAPLLGGYILFSNATAHSGADAVKLPYIILSGILLLIALFIRFTPLPHIIHDGERVKHAGALKHRHLVLGVICIFAYVGGEVAIGSNIISYLKLPAIGAFSESISKNYLAIFWGGAMIGRFSGAIALSQSISTAKKYLMMCGVVVASFVVCYIASTPEIAFMVAGLAAVNVLAYLLGRFIPQVTLTWFSVIVVALLIGGIALDGKWAMWSIVAIGFFNSMMFPTIFDLAIRNLGLYASQGASLLVMACAGGAVIPPLQGYFADAFHDLQLSFIVPLCCYLFIIYYGIAGYKQVKTNIAE